MPKLTQEQHVANMLRNLPDRVGHTADELIAKVQAAGLPDGKAQQAWLRSEFGLGRDQAMAVVFEMDRRAGKTEPTPEENLAGQYAGPKAALLPIYERLKDALLALGDDVTVEPRKTATSVFRARLIATVQPATKTRVDLYIAVPGMAETGRLKLSDRGGGRTTHVVGLTSPDEVDAELVGWLKEAYGGGL